MRKIGNGRALLLELLIVMLFFAVCASVLLNSILAVTSCTQRAEQKRIALRELQEDAAFMTTAACFEDALLERNYSREDGAWKTKRGELTLFAELSEESTKAGMLEKGWLTAQWNDDMLVELPVSRYNAQGGGGDE